MRLFVAVEVGAAAQSAALEIVGRLKDRVRRAAPRARITWAAADRMHLTLTFIGSVDAGRAATIEAALQPALAGGAFDLELAGLGAFPERGAPRVLWVGVRQGRDRLVELAGIVAGRLESAGIPAEGRPYRPHLTLGRVRDAAGLRGGPLLEGLTTVRVGATHVDAITLFESRLSPNGSVYQVLQRTALERT